MILSIFCIIFAGIILICILIPKSHPQYQISFTTLKLPATPNYYLACPENVCPVPNQRQSPVFDVSVDALDSHWQQILPTLKRVTLIASDPSRHQYTYQQRTPYLGFPDIINIQFLALNSHQSSVAILSQSKYGYSDLGMNEKRVSRWLNLLRKPSPENKVSLP